MASKTGNLPQCILDDLNSFDPAKRKATLAVAARDGREFLASPSNCANVHAHTFYSYSSMDFSPSRLVWEAARRGLAVIGSTDFDVLDAMNEMYEAGAMLGIPTTVSLETRAFAESYADREINSPGEPGVIYVMGAGFVAKPDVGGIFPGLAAQSRARNIEMVEKVNAVMGEAAIDYESDVLPLTPSGNATERHLCAAYDNKAREVFAVRSTLADFWAGRLEIATGKADTLLDYTGGLRNAIRAKLMKKGGVGYTQPGKGSFPKVEDFFRMVAGARAVPCLAWLDGTTAGESDPARLLDDALGWGARCVNIIPDRNWNIADPAAKEKKMAALDAFVSEARRRHLPILAGTEMNGPGQKFVDSFDAPDLAPYIDDFMAAAWWLYGHTVLARLARKGVGDEWEMRTFSGDAAASREFYAVVGKKAQGATKPDATALAAAETWEAVLSTL